MSTSLFQIFVHFVSLKLYINTPQNPGVNLGTAPLVVPVILHYNDTTMLWDWIRIEVIVHSMEHTDKHNDPLVSLDIVRS